MIIKIEIIMALIQIFFKNQLQQERTIEPDSTLYIGRKPQNDICISNLGVSSNHSKIENIEDDYYIEDLNSTNGTFVNGLAIDRKKLTDGDIITISKYELKFWHSISATQSSENKPDDIDSAEVEETINYNELSMESRHQQQKISSAIERGTARAKVVLLDKEGEKETIIIQEPIFTIGTAVDSDILLKGWMIPKIAAIIKVKQNGFFIAPQQHGKVKLNGVKIESLKPLNDADSIEIHNIAMKFYIFL